MKAIAEGKLREDLYYRLNVFTIVLPPLRDRREDMPMLARYFADELRGENGGVPSAFDARRARADDGVQLARQRARAEERDRALGAARRRRTDPARAPSRRRQAERAGSAWPRHRRARTGDVVSLPVGMSMDHAEREMIRTTLRHTSGNKTRAAKILGISLKTMHNKVKKYEL